VARFPGSGAPQLANDIAEQASPAPPAPESPSADNLDDENAQTLDEKIAAARSRLSPTDCLFCAQVSSSLEDNLLHMSGEHSFFIPDLEYLTDPTGLITYLGEKIAVGNVCIYCNGKGREFRTLDAVRKHMVDKSHCKIAYDTERDMLEISDFYDFSSSYPDAEERQRRKEARRAKRAAAEAAEGWEDVDGSDDNDNDGAVDEVVDEPASSETSSDSDSLLDDDDDDDENQITFGDSHLELVLPSGHRIGHRSMRRYYAQSFSGRQQPEDPNSGRAIVRRLLADKKHSALVPRKGGFGAFGAGTEVVKARNRGEAREAGRHIREFRDQKRKEDYKTRVAFVHNYQKHYRDPLLQVSHTHTTLGNADCFAHLHLLSVMSSLLYDDDRDAQEPVIKLNIVSPYKACSLKNLCLVLTALSPRDHKLLRDCARHKIM
jgi:pre-60S factor REI1